MNRPPSVSTVVGNTQSSELLFWFAAKGDSKAKPDDSTREAWEEGLEIEWAEAREAAARISAEADGRAIEKVLADMRNTGYDVSQTRSHDEAISLMQLYKLLCSG